MTRWPRCQGNLFLVRDEYGYHKVCLQCGYEGVPEMVFRRKPGGNYRWEEFPIKREKVRVSNG